MVGGIDGFAEDDYAATAVAPAAAADDDYREEPDDADDPRRGTTDLGLLILRLGVGGALLAHGLATFFGFAGVPGMAALQSRFSDAGYQFAEPLGIALPTIEVGSGALLVLGLAMPVGACFALAATLFMTMFAWSQTGSDKVGALISSGGGDDALRAAGDSLKEQALLAVGSLALMFTGPGRYGVDAAQRWARRPRFSSWFGFIVAVAAAVGVFYLATGVLPFVGAVGG